MDLSMDKNFDSRKAEEGKVDFWREQGYFQAGKDRKAIAKPKYSLIIPPPNVTGMLHIGHAKDTAEQDVVARYRRLKGYDVLYLPAMDHAGIATQARVEEKLRQEGKDKYALGRDGFLKEAWAWKEKFAARIHEQWQKLGLSLDLTRERFTLDPGMEKAVARVFKTLYDQGLIYQGERIINWDPVLKTALSNIEVDRKDVPGKFYYFKYVMKDDPKVFLSIATTRPETMFGDTALVFHPKDKRYLPYAGKTFVNPADGRELPLLCDDYVDRSFGTGVMKVTPAHDPNDYLIGKRHGLPMPVVMNPDATMNAFCGPYRGMDRYECREKLVSAIEKEGNLLKVEDIVHNVGHSSRSGAVVEPYLCKQWFVKMKPLAEAVLKFQQGKGKTRFFPSRFSFAFRRWLVSTEDWCISRQLWWGHRIPVYTEKATGKVFCFENPPEGEEAKRYEQDPDVLDTWFSSGLAPFAFLGWPKKTEDLKRYYPLDVMVTGYDILFFWVARMAFDGVHFTGEMPFRTVYLHGLIRDEKGRKMSKSLGNGIDPSEVIDKYGCDAMRWALTSSGAPGLDLPVGERNFASARDFVNKVWNASRYVISRLGEGLDFLPGKALKGSENRDGDKAYSMLKRENDGGLESLNKLPAHLSFIDRYVLSKFDQTVRKVTRNMDRFEHGKAAKNLYDFLYDTFCGQYLEWSKVTFQGEDEKAKDAARKVLYFILKGYLEMLFPYCPFLTEEIYSKLPWHRRSIYEESYPEPIPLFARRGEEEGEVLAQAIAFVRNFKAENGLAPNDKIDVDAFGDEREVADLKPYLIRFGFLEGFSRVKAPEDNMRFFGSFGLLLKVKDSGALSKRKEERIALLEKEIARGERMLSNDAFVNKANPAVVEKERAKLKANKEELERYRK